MPGQRARSPEAKASRRDTLLDAARRLLMASGTLDTLRIDRVAQEAGVAKGTVYMYFPSKEALLVTLFHATFAEWTDALVASPLPSPATPEALANAMLDASARVPLMAVLSRVLFSALDASVGALADTRPALLAPLDRCRRWLADALAFDEADALALLQQLLLVLVGMAQFTALPPQTHAALAPDAAAALLLPTPALLRDALVHLMTGWTLRRTGRPAPPCQAAAPDAATPPVRSSDT